MAYSGKFTPTNPKKYHGKADNIIYRSSWELSVFRALDTSPSIIWWNSEECIIPYIGPFDKKPHRYFVDIVFKKTDGKIYAIEIKPEKQTQEPKKPVKVNRKYVKEVVTYGTNLAKWKAAKMYCEERDWKFEVWTEKTLKSMGIKIL